MTTNKVKSAVSALQFLPARISMTSLREAAQECEGCPLYKNATQTVFGHGRRSARVFLVGEQPAASGLPKTEAARCAA